MLALAEIGSSEIADALTTGAFLATAIIGLGLLYWLLLRPGRRTRSPQGMVVPLILFGLLFGAWASFIRLTDMYWHSVRSAPFTNPEQQPSPPAPTPEAPPEPP